MAESIIVKLDMAMLRFPKAVDRRLQELLDRQSQGQSLSMKERQEAEGLIELAELISLLKMRADRVTKDGKTNGHAPSGKPRSTKKSPAHN